MKPKEFVIRTIKYLIKIEFGFLALRLATFRKDLNVFQDYSALKRHVMQSIKMAEQRKSKLSFLRAKSVLKIEGMSSEYVRHLYNNICSINDVNYLEIGSWKGASLISAGYKNKITQYAIDNWSLFNGPSDEFHSNVSKLSKSQKINFYDLDCFSEKAVNSIKKDSIQIYLFDGEHSENSQYLAITKYVQTLAKTAILMVDDYNLPAVQKGTQRGIKDSGIKVIFEKELLSKYNGDLSSWWNGLYVAILVKNS